MAISGLESLERTNDIRLLRSSGVRESTMIAYPSVSLSFFHAGIRGDEMATINQRLATS